VVEISTTPEFKTLAGGTAHSWIPIGPCLVLLQTRTQLRVLVSGLLMSMVSASRIEQNTTAPAHDSDDPVRFTL
jgi:hypothetical protein